MVTFVVVLLVVAVIGVGLWLHGRSNLRLARCSPIAILFLLACAGGSPGVARNPILLSSAPPPEGRTCFVSPRPETLPAGAALVDSAALLEQLRVSAPAARGYALVSVRFDDGGRAAAVRMIEGTLSPQEVQRQVSSVLKPQAPSPTWSVRIRISLDSVPALQIGRSEVCPATPRGQGGIDIKTAARSPSGAASEFRAPRLAILIDTTGQVLQMRVDESSGNDDVDRQFQDALRQRSFHPTLVDGVPILAWSRWPLQTR